jgi:phosphatidylglycerophosphate synthase
MESPEDWLGRLGQGSADAGIGFAIRVTDRNSRRKAARALLDSLRKPIDGVVSRYINRPSSLAITRFLVRTPLRPNHLTIFFAAIGIGAAVTVAFAEQWWAFALAAALLQTQSILDGCDGEIARLTYRFSFAGQWLDTIGDDLTNYLFCLGLAVGQARELNMPWLCVAGGVTLFFQCAVTVIMYRRLIQWGTGDLLAIPDTLTLGQVKGIWGKILAVLGVIRKRDVFVLVVAIVTAAQLPLVAFFMISVGTYASFVGILVNDIRISKMQRQEEQTVSE